MGALSGLRGQIGWMLRGRARTVGALDALSTDLRDLQQQVSALESAVREVQQRQHDMGAHQLDQLDRLRAAVATATDDLTSRVNAAQALVKAHVEART